MDYDVIVVGAGASGLVAAIAAAGGREKSIKGLPVKNKGKVLVIEQNNRAGRKIFATGNGKCNYTNLYQSPDCYRSDDNTFAMKVLSHFDAYKTIEFFKQLGIQPKEKNGYLYPNSEQASSIVEVLLMQCKRLNVEFAFGEKVIDITNPYYTVKTITVNNDKKTLNNKAINNIKPKNKYYYCKCLILSTGGCASPKHGSDGSGYIISKSLGHTLVKPLPALVQLKSPDKYCKALSGVRIIARVYAWGNNRELASEEGEIIFTNYGISGIPIMQISRYVAKALDNNIKVHLNLDLLPDISKAQAEELINNRIQYNPDKLTDELLIGLFNNKLAIVIINRAKLIPDKPCGKLTIGDINSLIGIIKKFKMIITGTNSFDNAQVCVGGVSTYEINPDTMESRIKSNLYLTGELIDIDGTCGGYNLQWAWSSGYLAGIHARH